MNLLNGKTKKMQRAIDEAKLAAIKLRTWTEKGIYSRLFDRHTNIRTDNNWLFFNVEGLGGPRCMHTEEQDERVEHCGRNSTPAHRHHGTTFRRP